MEFLHPDKPKPNARPATTKPPAPTSEPPIERQTNYQLKSRLAPRKVVLIAISAILLVAITTAWLLSRPESSNVNDRSTPSFTTILPGSKSIDQLGGWAKTSRDGANPTYSYSDQIDGVDILVSEQTLPDSFASDRDTSTAELARSISANQTFDAGSTRVYYGNSSKGPQSLIFHKSNLLILIKSTEPIKIDSWIQYISSLE